ncbi:MAG: hypothetical protein HGA90_02335 [Alphaproteobacteria bacterium]|nr:hypothetical protein [Alphaproteobacteria bacterium]
MLRSFLHAGKKLLRHPKTARLMAAFGLVGVVATSSGCMMNNKLYGFREGCFPSNSFCFVKVERPTQAQILVPVPRVDVNYRYHGGFRARIERGDYYTGRVYE